MNIYPIKLKKTKFENEFLNSRLEFNISGKNINEEYLNTIRRTIFSDIPIYTFKNIKIKKNTSVFNNNYLKLRIQNIPVIGIKNKEDFYIPENNNLEEEELILEELYDDNVDFSINNDINTSSLNQMTMYLEYKNDTTEIVTATTNDAKFYFGEKQIPSPYKTEIPLIDLQPSQEILFTAVTKLGIENESSINSPVSVNFYKQNKDSFDYILESRGQLTEKRILILALKNINKTIEKLLKSIPDDKGIEDKLLIPNADHTIGNLLSNGMFNHPSVLFSGYNMPHPLDKKVIIHYKLKSGNLKKILKDVIQYYTKLNNKIMELIEKKI